MFAHNDTRRAQLAEIMQRLRRGERLPGVDLDDATEWAITTSALSEPTTVRETRSLWFSYEPRRLTRADGFAVIVRSPEREACFGVAIFPSLHKATHWVGEQVRYDGETAAMFKEEVR